MNFVKKILYIVLIIIQSCNNVVELEIQDYQKCCERDLILGDEEWL